jgi:hypothetical protein
MSRAKKERLRTPRNKPGAEYKAIWRLIDGAILDALKHHPEYIAPERQQAARNSIIKRATGNVVGYLAQAKRGGR